MTTSSKPISGRKAGIFAVGLIVPCAVLGGLTVAQARPGAPQERPAFKNLKLIKDPAQVLPIMRKFNADLGVECGFCHVIGPNHSGFDKDDKPTKLAARKMMVMTQDLNKHVKVVDGKVTCFMCHHGHAEPEREPAGGGERR